MHLNFNNFSCNMVAVAAIACIVLFFNDMDQSHTALFFNNMDLNIFGSVQMCKSREVEVQTCNVKNIFHCKQILYEKDMTYKIKYLGTTNDKTHAG